MPHRSRLARRPLNHDQLLCHFRSAEALMDRALNLKDDEVEVWLTARNPVSGDEYRWKLSVACGPLLDVTHVEFMAQYSIELLVGFVEACDCGEDYLEGVWKQQYEEHPHDRDWRAITCAFAGWLLRVGWIFVDDNLVESDFIECEFSTTPEGLLLVGQKVRERGTPPIEPPHWQRASEQRRRWSEKREREKAAELEELERFRAGYPGEEPPF